MSVGILLTARVSALTRAPLPTMVCVTMEGQAVAGGRHAGLAQIVQTAQTPQEGQGRVGSWANLRCLALDTANAEGRMARVRVIVNQVGILVVRRQARHASSPRTWARKRLLEQPLSASLSFCWRRFSTTICFATSVQFS
jgi:hypothetical protein